MASKQRARPALLKALTCQHFADFSTTQTSPPALANGRSMSNPLCDGRDGLFPPDQSLQRAGKHLLPRRRQIAFAVTVVRNRLFEIP
jgi:hypothetical protein